MVILLDGAAQKDQSVRFLHDFRNDVERFADLPRTKELTVQIHCDGSDGIDAKDGKDRCEHRYVDQSEGDAAMDAVLQIAVPDFRFVKAQARAAFTFPAH